jgi:predicted ATPase
MLDNKHPLHGVTQELHTHNLCAELALELLTEVHVAEYLRARFPVNTLPAGLARALYERTEGNPLFLVNVVDDLVAQEVIAQGEEGWTLQGGLAVIEGQVPESIRHLIAKQSKRLLPAEQRVLQAASVAGMEFPTAAVAAALEADVAEVEEWCAGLATRQHFLRRLGISQWPDGTVGERYEFLHALYQHLWHERVGMRRRRLLHLRIGERQEAAYGNRVGEIAAELSVHFEEGQDFNRALQYRRQAAMNALQRSANQEAIVHLTRGLELLRMLPDTPERARHELRLQVALGAPLQATKGYSAPEVAHAYARARELCQQVVDPPELFPALWGLWAFHLVRAELATAHQLGDQLLCLAQRTHDPVWLLEAHRALGETLLWRGEGDLARSHLEQALALYDPKQLPAYAALYDLNDPRVLCVSREALALCLLGYPDRALTKISEVLALAQKLSAAFSLAMARNFAALLHHLRREVQAAHAHAEAACTLAAEHGFVQWAAWGTVLRGWALATQACPASQPGADEEGMRQIRQGLAAWQASGAELGRPYQLALLATAYEQRGQAAEGLTVLAETLTAVKKTRECIAEPELYRLRGKFTLRARDRSKEAGDRREEAEAEGWFQQALELARTQHTKWWELRAAISLSRLWQQQGRKAEARQLLAEIYGWFTEGFDTADLQEAKALLAELT